MEARKVRHYTLRIHDEFQRAVTVRGFDVENDIAAYAEAQSILEEQTIEIWEGSRQIGALKASLPLKLYI
jgi:hypothetical protein